jgi:hypothetical protein
VLSTVVGVPILLMVVVGLQILQNAKDPTEIQNMVNSLASTLLVPGALGTTWVTLSFAVAGRTLSSPYRDVFILTVLTCLRSIIGLACYASGGGGARSGVFLLFVILLLTFAQRTWTCTSAISVWLRTMFGPEATARLHPKLAISAIALVLLLTATSLGLILSAGVKREFNCTPLLYPQLSIMLVRVRLGVLPREGYLLSRSPSVRKLVKISIPQLCILMVVCVCVCAHA